MDQDKFRSILTNRFVWLGILCIVAIVSFFALGAHFSSADAYSKTIEALDDKRDTVMALVGASTATSAAITLLPGDAGTPIAEKLVDLSGDFTIVLAAIYLEKYLLTILGFLSFRVLVPVSCVLRALVEIWGKHAPHREDFARLSSKLAIFAVAVVLVVPTSVKVSSMIESTYEASITQTMEDAQNTASQIENQAAEADKEQSEEGGGFIETLASIPETLQNLPNEAAQLTDKARTALNSFVEALAVLIVTSCVIPILVLVFFIWLAKSVLGMEIRIPTQALAPRTLRHTHRLKP